MSAPKFVALSDLAHRRLTVRDLLPLLPAMLISFAFNFGFVVALMLFNDNPTNASASKKVALDLELPTADPKSDQELDLKAPDLDPPMEATAERPGFEGGPMELERPAGLEPPPDATAPSGVGPDKNGGIRGTDADRGLPGMPGLPLEGGMPGFPGGEGAGPDGDFGFGRGGPGAKDNGGWGWRTKRGRVAQSEGASNESEQAVSLGLAWLALHQNPAGNWSLDKYHRGVAGCRCKDLVFEADVQSNDTAATGLGLLPFLAAGHTHQNGSHKRVVSTALNSLLSRQDAAGDPGGGMYATGLATIALCEAYGMSGDKRLRAAAQNAVRFIVKAQNPREGSWRYMPRYPDGDISVLGWQVMALRSGQMAGLEVDAKALDAATKYLDTCGMEGGSKYGYQPSSGPTQPMTAAALLSRQYLGWGQRNPGLIRGCDFLLQQPPPAKNSPVQKLGPLYYYYYASQVMHNMGDKYWETWNPPMRDFLIRTQEKDGHKAGSWDPDGADWGKEGGRIYSTSLAILTLEVYYRYLPLYRRGGTAREAPPNEMK